jgi:hypothetical protein
MPKSEHPLHNADAGNHPMPNDPREVLAALRAFERCYAQHPYFEQRYGERGRAFTRSDGGYLVTLTDHPQAYVNSQVAWLAGLLANRGMPRWLMEQHLEILHDELTVVRPGRSDDYAKLGHAAQVLRSARQAFLSQADFDAIAGAFDVRTEHQLKNAGGLVAAAVCDECCGLSEAVPSLLNWLANPDIFADSWCEAVRDTISQTRTRVARI